MAALDLTDVRKTYASGDEEIVALDHATLEVGDDEVLAMVGPSGSGKTTLLSIAGGLLTPSEGSVIVGGQDTEVLGLNRQAQAQLRGPNRLDVVPGATHLFEEPGALERVAELARDWFAEYLRRQPR